MVTTEYGRGSLGYWRRGVCGLRPEWPTGLEESLTEFVLQRVAEGTNERQAILQFVMEGHTNKSFPAVYKRWRTKLRQTMVTLPDEQMVEIQSAVDVIRQLTDRIHELETEVASLKSPNAVSR